MYYCLIKMEIYNRITVQGFKTLKKKITDIDSEIIGY